MSILSKLTGMGNSAISPAMIERIRYGVKDLGNRAVDAVSDIDLTSAKGKLTSAVGSAYERGAGALSDLKDKASGSADVYDEALDDVFHLYRSAAYAGGGIGAVLDELKANNPYR